MKILVGHWNLAYKRLAATISSKVWFSYSHNCALTNGRVFYSVLIFQWPGPKFSFLATVHDCETGYLKANVLEKFGKLWAEIIDFSEIV